MSAATPNHMQLYPLPISQILNDENLAREFCADGLDLMQEQVAEYAGASANPADHKAHELFTAVLLEHFDFDLSETMGGKRNHVAELSHPEFESSAVAAFAQGYMARHGLGRDKSAEQAQEYFDRALGLGLKTALPCLVESLYGFCALDDPELASLCARAVESDDPLCCLHLGRLLLFGLELEEKDALRVQERLWDMGGEGSVDALRVLALLDTDHARYEGETPRGADAHARIRELAKQGAAWANLFCYEICAGLIPSFANCEEGQAKAYLKKAVEGGSVQAIFYDLLHDDIIEDPDTGLVTVPLNATISDAAMARLSDLAQRKIPRALLLLAAALHNDGAGSDDETGEDAEKAAQGRDEQVHQLLEKAFARRKMVPQSTCLVAHLAQRLRKAALAGWKAGMEPSDGQASGEQASKAFANANAALEEVLSLAEAGVADAQFVAAKIFLTGAFGEDADVERGAAYLARAVRAGHDEAIVFGVWARAVWESKTLDELDLPKHLCAGASWLKPNALATTFIAMYPPMVWLDPKSDPDTQAMKEMALAGIMEASNAVQSPIAQALMAMHGARALVRAMDDLGLGRLVEARAQEDLPVDFVSERLEELLRYVNAYGAVDALFQLLVLMDALPPVSDASELTLMGELLCRALRESGTGLAVEGETLAAARAAVLDLLARFGIAREKADEAAFLFVNWPQNACGSL